MKHGDAVYTREETSPDGTLNICYNHQEGEKSPTIVEPSVTVVATGEVIIDFWRTRLNGHLDDFRDNAFRLRVSDNYNRKEIVVQVDVASTSFTIDNSTDEPRPLSLLNDTLYWIIDLDRAGPAPIIDYSNSTEFSFLSQFLRRLK